MYLSSLITLDCEKFKLLLFLDKQFVVIIIYQFLFIMVVPLRPYSLPLESELRRRRKKVFFPHPLTPSPIIALPLKKNAASLMEGSSLSGDPACMVVHMIV